MNHVYMRSLPSRFLADTEIIGKALELAPWVAPAYAVLDQEELAVTSSVLFERYGRENPYRIGPGYTRGYNHTQAPRGGEEKHQSKSVRG